MIKKKIVLIWSLFFLVVESGAQDYKSEFNRYLTRKDTSGQRHVLLDWEKAKPNDAELFVAYYNYFVRKSMVATVALGQDPKGKEALQIMDKDTSKKEPVAYLYDETTYERELLQKGFDVIERGIQAYPDRLDMRFGKIYMYGEVKDYEKFTKDILKTIDHSFINKNKWTWSENKNRDDAKAFMLSSIQSYQMRLYNTGKDELLENMKLIAERILKYYPDHVESLSNLSIVYMLTEKYDKAIEVLLKAEKLAPQDHIVLGNIAHSYKLKGDKENAIKYYKLTEKYGDEQAKELAKGELEKLK